jgi:hypothetical protein
LKTMTETHEESGASDSPMRTVPIPWSLPREPVGLGQLIKGATSRVGLQPCASCERRAQRLDRWVRFGPVDITRGSSRRSVVVVAVTVAAAVGGAVAGGKLGRKAGSAAGTRLREKMQHRGTRPERLDSLVGYAEQGGEFLGSVVGGTVAALAALSLANRFLGSDGGGVLGPQPLVIGRPPPNYPDVTGMDPVGSVDLTVGPITAAYPHEVTPPTRAKLDCQANRQRCRRDVDKWYNDAIHDCFIRSHGSWRSFQACERGAISQRSTYLALCDHAWLCSSSACCGSGVSAFCKDLKTDPANCGTCGHACSGGMTCINGACGCPPDKFVCNLQGGRRSAARRRPGQESNAHNASPGGRQVLPFAFRMASPIRACAPTSPDRSPGLMADAGSSRGRVSGVDFSVGV